MTAANYLDHDAINSRHGSHRNSVELARI